MARREIIRLSRGLNQEGVAKELGITQNAYSKIETNQSKASEETVKKLAQFFGVSAEDIKSPEPVIINFHNSPQSNSAVGVNNGEVKNQNEQLLQQLTLQLAIKDKQIEELMAQNKMLLPLVGVLHQQDNRLINLRENRKIPKRRLRGSKRIPTWV